MIVNSNMNHSQIIMDQHQCDNFYLKRKLSQHDLIENCQSYVQPKKRHIRVLDNSFSQSFSENCDTAFNINNNAFNTDCQTIEFLTYHDGSLVAPVQTAEFATHDNYDPSGWSNSDLLELDQKYNSTINNAISCSDIDKMQQAQTHDQQNQQQQQQQQQNQELQQQHQPQQQQHHQPQQQQHQPQQQQQHHHHQQQQQQQQQHLHQDLSQHKISTISNTSQTESDFEDKNLSWLFNFKLDELPHLSPEINRPQIHPNLSSIKSSHKNPGQSKTGRKVDELIMEATAEIDENEMIVGENVVIENSPKMPKKPPFTYTELIEYALEDKGELTVSGIYQWISDRFPFYKSNDDRWKNSVRHNLSINPHFRKGIKAPQGAGHLWTISSRDSEENALAWEHKKQRLELFFKMETSTQKVTLSPSSIYDEAATAAANIARQLRNDSMSPEPITCNSPLCNKNNHQNSNNIGNDFMQQEDLKKTAGEILNGVHRNVEVQSVNTYHESLLESGDYLNPISKDDVVIESGLRASHNRHEVGNEFYVTEIDPIELGINMSNVEEEVLFSDEFNLNYFGITSGNDIMA